MLVQAGALSNLVRARRSGRGEIADSSGEFSQGKGGAERIMEGRSILTASFPSSFMNCRSALREERGVA